MVGSQSFVYTFISPFISFTNINYSTFCSRLFDNIHRGPSLLFPSSLLLPSSLYFVFNPKPQLPECMDNRHVPPLPASCVFSCNYSSSGCIVFRRLSWCVSMPTSPELILSHPVKWSVRFLPNSHACGVSTTRGPGALVGALFMDSCCSKGR